jgi:glucose-6-phosphate isomerase
LAKKQIPTLFLLKQASQYLEALVLLLNIHIFNFFTKEHQIFVLILSILLKKAVPLSSAQARGQAILLSSQKYSSYKELEKTNSNSPVNLFKLNKSSLQSLGFLISTWEHRVFVTAKMLQINPFDQYGVVAGKRIAKKFLVDGSRFKTSPQHAWNI